jgi:hypothetical protein
MSHEELIVSHMLNLGITRAEAEQLIEDDKRIDRGEKLFELTPEQKKAEKEARLGLGENSNKGKPKPKEKKEDVEKMEIIKLINSTLARAWENTDGETLNKFCEIEVTNEAREIVFKSNITDRKFKIVLSAPRT